jgi:hypothetical protein
VESGWKVVRSLALALPAVRFVCLHGGAYQDTSERKE